MGRGQKRRPVPSRTGWMMRGTLRRTSWAGVPTEGGTSGTARMQHIPTGRNGLRYNPGLVVQPQPGDTRCNHREGGK